MTIATEVHNAHGQLVARILPRGSRSVTGTHLARALVHYARKRMALLEARKGAMVDPSEVGGQKYIVPSFEDIAFEWQASKDAEAMLNDALNGTTLNRGHVWKLANLLIEAGCVYNGPQLYKTCIKLGATDDLGRFPTEEAAPEAAPATPSMRETVGVQESAGAGRLRDAQGRFVSTR